ncbi:MAG TPA: arginine--tRNA ligase [Acetobacteraceae bacterium]|jgi:arginyl-tRNA synthetase|nr:arginine--tRNA ligase [Acetobacteraceae bacterium]
MNASDRSARIRETDIYARLRETVLAALAQVVPDLPPEIAARVEVSPAKDPAHGDMATNAAMVSAKAARQPPAKIAAALVQHLTASPDIQTAEAAGPGFVNLRLKPQAFRALLPVILSSGEAYGDATTGTGTKINVEYVSANPTGPMHIGHCRGAVVGDALANLLTKAGFDVTKEYYINDAGAQVTALAWAAYWRYLQAIGSPMTEEEFANEVPGGLQYKGEYLIQVGQALATQYLASLATPDLGIASPELWIDTVKDHTIHAMMTEIREDLRLLGVQQDIFSSERALVASGAADRIIEKLHADGLIYEGVLEPPKGKTPEDWEPRPQTLFRSTEFGDDVDRPLRKSDGSNTYFANDIAYHADKIDRGYDVLIDILGADHGGYVPRMKAAVKALSQGTTKFDAVLCQIVHIMKGGQPVRMSKRAGTYVTLRDLLEEVGKDAVRFTMLTRNSDAQMEFDLDKVLATTRENPVFYVQYAHARCRSVLRAAAEITTTDDLATASVDTLASEPELTLIRRLALWPRTVEAAALAHEPHRIAFFLYDLAADFHMLWNRGKDDATLRFIQADHLQETRARLALVAATAVVIRSGLQVMGVTPVEEMR